MDFLTGIYLAIVRFWARLQGRAEQAANDRAASDKATLEAVRQRERIQAEDAKLGDVELTDELKRMRKYHPKTDRS